jgi:hypothetical protein
MDLAILDHRSNYPVKVAIELKYEPSHDRQGYAIRPDKYPKGQGNDATIWNTQRNGGSIQDDIPRINKLIDTGIAEVAYAIIIDECGFHHRTRPPISGCEWLKWKPKDTSLSPWVHWFRRSYSVL